MRILNCLLGLCLLTTACDEDDNQSDGEEPPIDAAPQVDGGGEVADAALPDAGPATLTVVARGRINPGPAEGAPVLVLDSEGALVSETPTDSSGLATVTVEAGDSVVVLLTEASKGLVYSGVHFVGVKAGDTLHVGRAGFQDSFGQLSVTGPGDLKSASGYVAYTGCGEQTFSPTTQEGPIVVDMYPACHGAQTTTPVLLTADFNGDLISYAVETEQPIDQPVTFEAWRNDFLEIETTLNGFSPGSEFANTSLYLLTSGGQDFRMFPVPIFTGLPVQSEDWKLPQDLASHWATEIDINSKGGQSDRSLIRVGTWPISNQTTQYPDDFLPRVVNLDTTKTGGPAAQISYELDTEGAGTPDGAVFRMRFNSVEWLLVHPGADTQVGLPPLGEAYADWMPTDKDFLFGGFVLIADTDEEAAPGYDRLRNFIAVAVDEEESSLFELLRPLFLGQTGELRVSSADTFFGDL